MIRLNSLSTWLLMCSLFILSCSKDNGKGSIEVDYSEILLNTGQNVILKTYEDLAIKTSILYHACLMLEEDPTAANLDAAKTAWADARSPWEQSEGFLFGPVDQEGIDPSLDSWPVNVVDLNSVLASHHPLTIDFLSQQEGNLKGFHTIEFLLWGEGSNKLISDFNSREFEFLSAAAGVLMSDASKLFELWRPENGNYIKNIIQAGNGSAIYISQKSALEEITNALIIIADEVANGKINDPLVQKDLTLEESRFSENSKADFANNIRSIKNVYTGKFSHFGDGRSISDIILSKNSSINDEVLQHIENAISSIESIPGSFSEAVFKNPLYVEKAQAAVRDLQKVLEQKILPIISNL